MTILKKLEEYNNSLINVPTVTESSFNQIILKFENRIEEPLFTSAMPVYLSTLLQIESIHPYLNRFEHPRNRHCILALRQLHLGFHYPKNQAPHQLNLRPFP